MLFDAFFVRKRQIIPDQCEINAFRTRIFRMQPKFVGSSHDWQLKRFIIRIQSAFIVLTRLTLALPARFLPAASPETPDVRPR